MTRTSCFAERTVPTADTDLTTRVPHVTWPDEVTEVTYTGDDGPDRTFAYSAAIDPEANQGWSRIHFTLAGESVRVDGGDNLGGVMHACGVCRGPWAVTVAEAYGDRTTCPCGHTAWYGIGD